MNIKKFLYINKEVNAVYQEYKIHDNKVMKLLYRGTSLPLTSIAQFIGLSANQVTFFKLFTLLLSIFFTLQVSKAYTFLGALLFYFTFILDCVDGNLARTQKNKTFYGKLIDGFSDNLCSLIYIFISISLVNKGQYSNFETLIIISAGFCIPLFDFIGNSFVVKANELITLSKKNDNNQQKEIYEIKKVSRKKVIFNVFEDLMLFSPLVYGISVIYDFQIFFLLVFSSLRVFLTTVEITFKLVRYSSLLNVKRS